MRRIPKIKIPASFFEKDGDVDALPDPHGLSVVRLDSHALIVESLVLSNPLLSFFLSAALH